MGSNLNPDFSSIITFEYCRMIPDDYSPMAADTDFVKSFICIKRSFFPSFSAIFGFKKKPILSYGVSFPIIFKAD